MRIPLLLVLLLLAAAPHIQAQDTNSYGRVVLGPGDKGRALVTALTFSSALAADSVGVAGCTAERAVGKADYEAVVRPAIEGRNVQPAVVDDLFGGCSVMNLREEGKTRLFIESLDQINRESSSILPYPERVAFDVTLQVLVGRGYREWHRITVRPLRMEMTPEQTNKVLSWRVIRYEVTGWQWTHENSSSGGPIR